MFKWNLDCDASNDATHLITDRNSSLFGIIPFTKRRTWREYNHPSPARVRHIVTFARVSISPFVNLTEIFSPFFEILYR
jgi:hypothetical protein